MTSSSSSAPRRMALHNRIFVGLMLGAAAGVTTNLLAGGTRTVEWIVSYITDPFGQIFLRMLIMIVVPLVFASLTLGIAGFGDLSRLGRVGAKTMLYFLLVTLLAAGIGLTLVNTIRPGDGLPSEIKERLLLTYQGQAQDSITRVGQTGFGIQTLVNIVPRNPLKAAAEGDMLAIIFFAILFGVALTRIDKERSRTLISFLEGLLDVTVVIIDLAMKLAPFGVAALIFSVTSRFGFDLLAKLGLYVATVLAGLLIHQFIGLSLLVKIFAKLNPIHFFRSIRAVMLTAFSTSSSSATLPTTIRVSEQELGVPRQIAGFVLPLGATMNMNGTALFEGVTVLFLAQVFGIQLGLGAQAIVVVMSVLTAVGAAGVPGGSIPLLILVLQTVGVPGEGIAIILGVDRLLDMCRTVLNVSGDISAAVFVTRSEGLPLEVPGALVLTGAAAEPAN
ncbi:MAG: dicarboxylate/amino acid:cation symporter [Acidobacteria bacterium]|nr:dicarboxylate/amino acid:cation symporter [Acidobacteriota bacterium]